MKIEAIIFDMDGVIFDSERCCLALWQELAHRNGLLDIERTFYRCIGTTVPATKRILKEQYGADFDPDAYMEEASQLFHARYDHGELPVLPYARDILPYLKENGYKVGLASSTREETVRLQLGNAGLLSYFDYVTCGDMLQKSKPEPDIYLLACKNLNVLPEHAVAIEDSYNGIRSAHAAGMFPVMVPDLIPADEEMERLSYRIFPDLGEVLSWFKNGLP